jgi:hypothetical protein
MSSSLTLIALLTVGAGCAGPSAADHQRLVTYNNTGRSHLLKLNVGETASTFLVPPDSGGVVYDGKGVKLIAQLLNDACSVLDQTQVSPSDTLFLGITQGPDGDEVAIRPVSEEPAFKQVSATVVQPIVGLCG